MTPLSFAKLSVRGATVGDLLRGQSGLGCVKAVGPDRRQERLAGGESHLVASFQQRFG
jgi:hypothetical protein